MIEALVQIIAFAFGQVLIQGVGYWALRPWHRQREPSEGLCTVVGALLWLGLGVSVFMLITGEPPR